jgi:hypothetical protein
MVRIGRPAGAPRLRKPNAANATGKSKKKPSAHRVLPKGMRAPSANNIARAVANLTAALEYEKAAGANARKRGHALVAAFHGHRVAELRAKINQLVRNRR